MEGRTGGQLQKEVIHWWRAFEHISGIDSLSLAAFFNRIMRMSLHFEDNEFAFEEISFHNEMFSSPIFCVL